MGQLREVPGFPGPFGQDTDAPTGTDGSRPEAEEPRGGVTEVHRYAVGAHVTVALTQP